MKKTISTDQTSENIVRILEILSRTPERMERLLGDIPVSETGRPIAPGERSPSEVLAHLIYTEALSSDHIFKALLVDEPKLVMVHAQRELGKLLKLESFSIPELLAYIRFRRKALLPVLQALTDRKWSRTMDKGIRRKESVYWAARGLALHELEHLQDISEKLGAAFDP